MLKSSITKIFKLPCINIVEEKRKRGENMDRYERRAKDILDGKYRDLLTLYLVEKWRDLIKKLNKKEKKEFKKLKLSQRLFYVFLRIVDALPHKKALKKCESGL